MNKRAATIGLGAFLLADIVLVALALRPPPVNTDQQAIPAGTARPAATATGTGAGGGTTTSTAAPTKPATTKATSPVPVQRMIVGIDADNAWRATMGSCDAGGSLVQVTDDGGRTWTKGTSPSKAVARIQPLEGGVGFVYAAGPDCSLEEWTTRDNSATWTGPKAIVGAWTRQIAQATEVATPNDPAATPCGTVAVLDLSRTSAEQAEALCANGKVLVTNDGGTSWDDSGSAPGAVALSNRLEDSVLTTYAAQIASSCAGVQVVKVIQGKAAAPLACVETETTPEAGQVGISAATAGWLVVGDETWTSGADLTTWEPSA
jgi:hypothetical protein